MLGIEKKMKKSKVSRFERPVHRIYLKKQRIISFVKSQISLLQNT